MSANTTVAWRRSPARAGAVAGAAGSFSAGVAPGDTGVPQFEQKRAFSASEVPQLAQLRARAWPHSWQNFACGAFS